MRQDQKGEARSVELLTSSAMDKADAAGAAPKVRQARSVATQNRLLAAARTLFAQSGFHDTGINDLLAKAVATRGALYHHFADKGELFEAVFRLVAADLHDAGAKSAAPFSGDPWRQLITAVNTHLKLVASNAEFQRILLIDGPVVLGWQRWRSILSEYLLKGFVITLDILMDRKIIAAQPTEPLATLIMGALDDSSLAIAHAKDPQEAQMQFAAALISLIEGLKIRA